MAGVNRYVEELDAKEKIEQSERIEFRKTG